MALDQTGVRVADLAAVTSAAATDSFLVETAGGTKRIQKQHLIPDLAGVTALENRLQTNGAQFTLDYRDGQWGWNEKPTRGADTFHPFKSANTGPNTADKVWYITGAKAAGSYGEWTVDIKPYCDEWADIDVDSDQWTLLATTKTVYGALEAAMVDALGSYHRSSGNVVFGNLQSRATIYYIVIIKWYE